MKIVFWRTVADAYGFFFNNIERLVALSGIWLVAIFIAGFVVLLLSWLSIFLAIALGFVSAIILYMGGFTAFAVAWHRAILRNDESAMSLGFGPREWRFLGYCVVIGLVVGGSIFLGELVFGAFAYAMVAALGTVGMVFFVLPFAVMVIGWLLGSRLMLALPAVAVDEQGDMLTTAWRRGRGNGVRLFFGPLVCIIPFVIAQFILRGIFGLFGISVVGRGFNLWAIPSFSSFIFSMLFVVLYFMQAAVTVGFLSYAYRQVAENAPAAGGPVAQPAE